MPEIFSPTRTYHLRFVSTPTIDIELKFWWIVIQDSLRSTLEAKAVLQDTTTGSAGGLLPTTKKEPAEAGSLCWRYLSFRAVTRKVLSAQMSLTSVFGMGTGVPSPQSTPTIWGHTLKTEQEWMGSVMSLQPSLLPSFVGQAFGLLVSVSYMPYSTYTPDLSTT